MADLEKIEVKGVNEELLLQGGPHMGRHRIPYIIVNAIIASLASQYFPFYLWFGWFLMTVIACMVPWGSMYSWFKLSSLDTGYLYPLAVGLSLFGCLVNLSSLYFFASFTLMEKAMLTLALTSFCVHTIALSCGSRSMYLAHLIPTVLAVSAIWAVYALSSDSVREGLYVAALYPAIGWLLYSTAQETFRTSEELIALRDQEHYLNEKLVSALEEAGNSDRSKTRFLAAASHDLRQPIHTLSLFSAALDMQTLDAKTSEIVGHMNSALESLGSQLDALLDISKLDARHVEVNNTQFALNPLIQRLRDEFSPIADAANIAIEVNLCQDVLVHSDSILLERVLRNLISNSLRYTHEGGVYISTTLEGKELSLCIQDTGIGIAANDQKHIYEEFYQVGNTERDKRKGLGLGLSIVKRLSDLLELDINLESALDKGTSFSLKLAAVDYSPVTAPESTQKTNLEGLKVLVVDDEESIQVAMKALLEEIGCDVTLAESGIAALTKIGQRGIDIALVDFRLKRNENGLQVVKQLRDKIPNLPAMIISGDTEVERIIKNQNEDIRLLRKPLSVDNLTSAMVKEFQLQC